MLVGFDWLIFIVRKEEYFDWLGYLFKFIFGGEG